MKRLVTALAFAGTVCWGASALAQAEAPAAPDCAAKATEKKLAGAARNSFTKKCVKDATQQPAAQ
jgi:hypothetical protein